MNLEPLIGLWWRRSTQIKAIFAGGKGNGSALFLDFIQTNADFVKRNFPQYNPDGLVDDVVATVKQVFAPEPPPSTGSSQDNG